MVNEILQELIHCSRHAAQYRFGMTVGACVRHQVEQKVVRGPKGEEVARAHSHPICSMECAFGAQLLERVQNAGIVARACPGCGQALIGERGMPCETCVAREMETSKTMPASGFLPTREEASERIWDGSLPDVPLGPAPTTLSPGDAAVAEAVARVRKSAPMAAPWAAQGTRIIPRNIPAEVDQDEEPAEPAEEDEMGDPKECCGSKGQRHLKGCKVKEAKPALPARPRGSAVRERRTLVRVASHKLFDVKEASVEQLVETIEVCRSELEVRRGSLRAQLNAVAEALGEAA